MGANAKQAIPIEQFLKIRASIGIFREKQMDSKRRADRLAKEKALEEQREKLKGLIAQAEKAVDDAETEVKAMDANSYPLAAKAKAATSKEGLALADEAAEKVQKAKDTVASAKTEVEELKTEVDELKGFLNSEVIKMRKRMSSFDQRVTRASATVAKVREDAAKKMQQEIVDIRKAAMGLIRHHQSE